MTTSTTVTLACRGCGRTPDETRTPVATGSSAYTCSRCLMGGAVSLQNEGPPVLSHRRPPPVSEVRETAHVSEGVFRHIEAWGSSRPPARGAAAPKPRARPPPPRHRGMIGYHRGRQWGSGGLHDVKRRCSDLRPRVCPQFL
jgi:hypothetical protein